MSKLNKKYNFKESEEKWQKYWQDNNIFKFDWNDVENRNFYLIGYDDNSLQSERYILKKTYDKFATHN